MVMRVLLALLLGLGGVLGAEVPLEIELVSSVKAVQPGQPFYVALSLKHGRGYHSYWKIPGIVGVPTSIEWDDVPRGFKISGIEWPEPERVFMFQIKTQGYERDVVLPMLVTPSKSVKPGQSVTLRGRAGWMSCAKQCNPGFKELSITLPVTESVEPQYDDGWRKRIDQERALAPRDSTAWVATAVEQDGRFTVTVTPQAGARPISEKEARKLIYFTDDGQVDTDKPQIIEWKDGSILFHLERAEYVPGGRKRTLSGILVREGGWNADGSVRAMRIVGKL